MRNDLRVKHDIETRRRAIELFESGRGCGTVSGALSVPRGTVEDGVANVGVSAKAL